MKKISRLIILYCSALNITYAQPEQDAGMWNTISVEKKLTDRLSLAIDEEFRLRENFTRLNLFYTNVGFNYKLNDLLKLTLTYRLIEKWRYESQNFSFRHRLMFDINLKYKHNRWALTYRSRIQSEVRDYYTSENGKTPEWYWRNKLELKYKVGDWNSNIGSEFRYQIYDLRNFDSNAGWHRARYFAGIDYEIKKNNFIGLYYLIQREFGLVQPNYLYILGLQYAIELD
jgi:hypothetical protein